MEFEEICRKSYAKIYNYILARTGQKEAAEDLVQDVFFIALKKGDAFLAHEKPIAFLYATAKRLILYYYRQSAKIHYKDIAEESSAKDAFEELCANRDLLIDESLYQKRLLLALTKSEQDLYKAYYVKKTPMKTIARDLGVSEAAVRMKYVRIRKKVRQMIAQLKLNDF